MNVAVCVSGLTRSVSYAWPLIERYLVRPFKSSIFIHTWDIDHGGERFKCHMKEITPAPSFTDGRSKKDFIEQEIGPKKYIIEEYAVFAVHNPLVVSAMYYSIYKSNELRKAYEKETDIKYDLIIRSRMDAFYETFMNESEINDVLVNNDVIYGNAPGADPDPRWISDAFAFSGDKAMQIYANTWCDQVMRGGPGELILQDQLYGQGLKFKWSKIHYKLTEEWSSSTVKVRGNF